MIYSIGQGGIMFMRKNINLVTTSLAFAAMLMVASAAYATTVYDLTSDDCTGGCGPQTPSFGTITLTTIATGNVQVTINLFNNNRFVNTGFDGTIDFNLLGNPTIQVSGLPANWSLVGGPNAPAGDHSMDGLGVFDYAILWGPQGGGAADGSTLTFNVLATGITEASFADPSRPPSGPAFFGVDIISGTTGLTGPVDASNAGHPPAGKIPEPSTLLLFGSGLVALSVFVRSRLARR
jgi:PEP-CTERM motif-containing protein